MSSVNQQSTEAEKQVWTKREPVRRVTEEENPTREPSCETIFIHYQSGAATEQSA